MFIAAKEMYGAPLEGSDGRVGSLYDFLFDDQSWKLRHLVVSIDRWCLGRHVLLYPEVLNGMNWPDRRLHVQLTKEQMWEAPGTETDLPTARYESLSAAQVLVWEAYWSSIQESSTEIQGNPNLHSTRMLTGMHLHCSDGQLGHIDDFVIDTSSWFIRDLVVDTRNWWPGKRVLIEPSLVEKIDWDEREVRLSVPRDQIEHRPAYQMATLEEMSAAGHS